MVWTQYEILLFLINKDDDDDDDNDDNNNNNNNNNKLLAGGICIQIMLSHNFMFNISEILIKLT